MTTSLRLLVAIMLVFSFFSCKESPDKQAVKSAESVADSVSSSGIHEQPVTHSTIVIAVKPLERSYSAEFSEFITIAKQMNYTSTGIQRTDSIDFHCWKRGAEADWIGRLVYKGITTHCVSLKEKTSARVKKGMYLEEAIFSSAQEAMTAEQKIRDFIFQDSTTNAYDKRPTDIFRYKNSLYKLSVGAFMSIPDMKVACRRFRKALGPFTAKIMLWDYYGYGE